MKKLLLAAVLVFTTGYLHAQAPLTYAQAAAARKALDASKSGATYTQKIAADQAIIAAPDVSTNAKSNVLHEMAGLMQRNGAAKGDVIDVLWQAAQVNSWNFEEYLETSIRFGDPYKTTAIGRVAAFVSANPGSSIAFKAEAVAAQSTGQFDAAIGYYTGLCNLSRTYTLERGWAIAKVADCSVARGDDAKTTNTLIIPLLTAYNVHMADKNYKYAYSKVNRSVGLHGSFASVGDLAAFLNNINSLVDTTTANKDFLSLVQSQLAAVTSNSN